MTQPQQKPVTVLELLSTLRRLLAEQRDFHRAAAVQTDEALLLLSKIEGQFGFTALRDAADLKAGTAVALSDLASRMAKKASPSQKTEQKTAKKAGKKKPKPSKRSPIKRLLDKQSQTKPPLRQPVGKQATIPPVPPGIAKRGIGGFTHTGPKSGAAAGTVQPKVQLSVLETKLFRALTSKPGPISMAELERVRGLDKRRVYTCVHRLRQKGYKIKRTDEGYSLKH